MSIPHPVDFAHTTEVLLPEKLSVTPEQTRVDDPAFEFERSVSNKGDQLVLADHFRSRVDHIAAADAPRYFANLERARDAVGYVLYKVDRPLGTKPSGIERLNWSVAGVAILLLALWTWLAARVFRYDPPPSAEPVDAKLQGIRGWLILPAIGVLVLPLRTIAILVELAPSYAADTWANLTTAGSAAYHNLWAPLLLFELSVHLAQFVFSLLLAVLFFQKRRSAPIVFVALMCANALFQVIDLLLASVIPAVAAQASAKEWAEVTQTVLTLAIWVAYFKVSRRVKATFVNTRNQPVLRAARLEPAA